MFGSPQGLSREDSKKGNSSFTKATLMLTGSAPPIHKQIKTAIMEGNEDKAISLYMSKEGAKVHPSKAIPSKKADSTEDTPMHLASKYVLVKLFKMFLEYGGHPGALNIRHENCAHAACMLTSFPSKRADILDVIFDWRATRADNSLDYVYLDQVDVDGNTALHIAAFNGLLPCIERLIQRGATLSLINRMDMSACDMADQSGRIQLATMLELAWIYQFDMTTHDAMHAYQKHTTNDQPAGRILLDGISMPLSGFIEFMNKAIQTSAGVLSETPARAEVLLDCYGWDVNLLKKEFATSTEKTLSTARLKTRVTVFDEVKKESDVLCGVSVEECYLDPCWASIASFTVAKEGKKLAYAFHHFDGKAAVHPLNYNPDAKNLDNNISSLSHVQPKETEPCVLCGKTMLEAASIHNFLTGTIVEAQRRELQCGSGHTYCVHCWSDHVQMTMKRDSSMGHLSCPTANCGEALDLQWAPVLLKKAELVNRLMAQRQKHVIEALNLRFCPVAGCGLLVHVHGSLPQMPTTPHGSNAPGTIVSAMSSTCYPCSQPPKAAICGNGHAFCLQCSKEAHSPCRCGDVAVWGEWLREESTGSSNAHGGPNALVNMMLHHSNQKTCGVCRTVLTKSEGCNIVRCGTCEDQYCWMCMQPWSMHSNRNNNILYCNRFRDPSELLGAANDGTLEEKSDDIAIVHKKLRLQRFGRLLHYNQRHMAHGESMKMESAGRKLIEERIYNGLVASFEGDLVWLQGSRVANPLTEKAKELEAYNAIRGLDGEGLVNVADYYQPREDAIEFLIDAFDELEKCRSFLKWTYPFYVLEFDEKFTNGSDKFAGRPKEQLDEVRSEFIALQGSLEFLTETLSDAISRKRIRSTKANILMLHLAAKAKRLEFEQFVFSFYAAHAVVDDEDKAVPETVLSGASSLTSWDSRERHSQEKKISQSKSGDEIQERGMDAVLQGIANLTASPRPVLKPMSGAISSDSESDEEENVKPFAKPPLQQKPSSYFQAAAAAAPMPPPPAQPKTRSFYRTNSAGNVVANQEPAPVEEPPAPQPKELALLPSRSLIRVGSSLNANMVSGAARKKIVIQSLYQEEERPRPVVQPEPEPLSDSEPEPEPEPEPAVVETQRRFEVIREKPVEPAPPALPQYIIEQRMIAAKKDPDQEALEHAIFISKQEEDYGINMYDALTDEDEPIIEDFVAQGFTREEAILIIFEEKMGIQRANAITPAMPTLHKISQEGPAALPAGFIITDEVEREIEGLMRKGYTREQAIEVLARRKQTDERLAAESMHSQSMYLVQGPTAQPAPSFGAYSYQQSAHQHAPPAMVGDPKIAELMALGLTMEQALAITEEERRAASERAIATISRASRAADDSSVARSYADANQDLGGGDPEIDHLVSMGYTYEQAVQVISSRPKPPSRTERRSGDSVGQQLREEEYTARGFNNREQATSSMLQSMTFSAPAPTPAPESMDSYNRSAGAGSAPRRNPSGQYGSGASVSGPPVARQGIYNNMAAAPMAPSDPALSLVSPPRGAIFRASMQNVYEAPPPLQDEYYGGGEYLPPARSSPAMRAPSGSTDNLNNPGNAYAPSQSGTSFYGSTVVGDYDYLPPHTQLPAQPGPQQDDARNALLMQQQAEFGVHMYDALTPADGPEIQRLMSEGCTEDDAIQMIFDFRYRSQTNQRGYFTQGGNAASQYSSNSNGNGNGYYPSNGGGIAAPTRANSVGSMNGAAMRPSGEPRRHQPAHEPPAGTHGGSANSQHKQKKLVSRVSSMFQTNKVRLEGGDPMEHAIMQSQQEQQHKKSKMKYKPADVKQLTKMGFNEAMAVQALLENDNDVNAAANALMSR